MRFIFLNRKTPEFIRRDNYTKIKYLPSKRWEVKPVECSVGTNPLTFVNRLAEYDAVKQKSL